MKKPERSARHAAVSENDEMKPEYDFSNGRRGEYASRYAQGTNVILLDADVYAVFRDSLAVNEALRTLIRVTHKARKPKPRRGSGAR
jgi:hypothetical protein